MGHALGIGGLAQHRGLIELQQTVQVAAQMMEQRLQLVEIGGTSVDGLVVRRFRSPDVIDNLLLARFSDIGGGACKRVFESPAVFRNLALRAVRFAEQYEQRAGVLPFEAFLHDLDGDDRLVVFRQDALRNCARLVELPETPDPEKSDRGDEYEVAGAQLLSKRHVVIARPARHSGSAH